MWTIGCSLVPSTAGSPCRSPHDGRPSADAPEGLLARINLLSTEQANPHNMAGASAPFHSTTASGRKQRLPNILTGCSSGCVVDRVDIGDSSGLIGGLVHGTLAYLRNLSLNLFDNLFGTFVVRGCKDEE